MGDHLDRVLPVDVAQVVRALLRCDHRRAHVVVMVHGATPATVCLTCGSRHDRMGWARPSMLDELERAIEAIDAPPRLLAELSPDALTLLVYLRKLAVPAWPGAPKPAVITYADAQTRAPGAADELVRRGLARMSGLSDVSLTPWGLELARHAQRLAGEALEHKVTP